MVWTSVTETDWLACKDLVEGCLDES